MNSLRTAGALALAAVTALAFAPAVDLDPQRPDLAEVEFVLEDPAGDANGINDQGLLGDPTSVETGPASYGVLDITGVRFNSLWNDVVGADELTDHVYAGIEFRVALEAEPTALGPAVLYRFELDANGCQMFVTAYSGALVLPTGVRLFSGCGGDDRTVNGDYITQRWDAATGELVITIDAATAPAELLTYFERGDKFAITLMEANVNSIAVVRPSGDLAYGGTSKAFKFEVGSDIPADEEPEEEPTAPAEGTEG